MSRPRSPIDLKLVATIAIIGLGLLGSAMGVLSASALRDRSPVTERQGLSAQVDIPATRAELGRMLFFDKRLSGDATISCATCHSPEMAWADGRPLSRGYGRNTLYFRNTPTLLNADRMELLDWDGRFAGDDLAGAVRDHLAEAHFMNIDGRLLVERMRQVLQYEKDFKELFGDEVSYGKVLTALVASTEHPYLRYLDGAAALSDQAKVGLELFRGKAGCSQCHGGELLTDGEFHALGVPDNQVVFQEPMRHMVFRRFLREFGVSDYVAIRSDPGLFS